MSESMIPMIVLPLTFLFVLLIILIAKAPKAGACVVGGLVLLAPLGLWRLAAAGALRHEEAIPIVVLPATFLFVLMVILLGKAPKVGAPLLVALVAMIVLGLFFIPFVAYERTSYMPTDGEPPTSQPATTTVKRLAIHNPATGEAVAQEFDRDGSWKLQVGNQDSATGDVVVQKFDEPVLVPPLPKVSAPVAPSPIWSDAIEEEFKADVYSSKLAAVRAAGVQLGKSIRQLVADVNSPPHVVIFQGGHEYQLIASLRDAVGRMLPDVSCDIEADVRTPGSDELGVTLYDNPDMHWTPGVGGTTLASGGLDVNLSGHNGKVHIAVRFMEKPWVESFGVFASERPEQHFIVARSNETCTSESEARQQALEDARARLTEALGKRSLLPEPAITTTDVLQGGFVADQFAQSFEGSAGKIWRQAMLIDVSGPKLTHLFSQKVHESRRMRESWARMGFSVIGVVVLIGAIYFFLNMATRGYYEWSLRIAGIVLAIVAVISILMVVK
jgi:hypothetical protein